MRGLKKNAARSGRHLLLAWALVGAWATSAQAAKPRVLVLESSGAPAGFLVALQIQLSGLATPERLVVPPAAGTAESIERAGELVRSHNALAAVWVDRSRGAGPAVVYVVGERERRALIEVVRVAGDRGPDLDRTIALKVRELVAAMRRGQAAGPDAAQLLQAVETSAETLPPSAAQPAAALPSEQSEATTGQPPTWATVAFAGVRLGSQPELGLGRWGFGLGAGPTLDLRELRVAMLLAFEVFPSIEIERAADRIRFWEWAASTTLHGQLRSGAIWLGLRLGPQLVGVNARGMTRGGRGGSATPTSWAGIVGLDAEVPITNHVSLIAGVQLQALASRLHLAVNDDDLVDLGRMRARIGLDLAARF